MNQEELQQELRELLEEGKKITVSWDCGGDEAFAYIQVDGKQLKYGNPLAEAMDMFLINRLDLPSAGEFSLEGTGSLAFKEEKIWITYASQSEDGMCQEEYEEMVEAMKAHDPEQSLPPFEETQGMQPDDYYTGSVELFLD